MKYGLCVVRKLDVVIGLRFYETIKRENENLCFIFLVVFIFKRSVTKKYDLVFTVEKGV